MKKLIYLLLIIAALGCSKDDGSRDIIIPPQQDTTPPPAPIITGSVMFYIDTATVPGDYWNYGFELSINGKFIDGNNIQFIGMEPNCGNWYALNYYDTAKTYSFHIEKLGGSAIHWDSTFTIIADSCFKIALKNQRTF